MVIFEDNCCVMALNEERNIVLKAFYYDLDRGHRINVERIVTHLKNKTTIDHNRIHVVLYDLEKEGYIEQIPLTNDYKTELSLSVQIMAKIKKLKSITHGLIICLTSFYYRLDITFGNYRQKFYRYPAKA